MAFVDTLTPRGQRQLRTAIRNALTKMGGRRMTGKDQRERTRHACLFHQDDTPSADYYADDGWYYCHGCGITAPLDDVVEALDALDADELKVDFEQKRTAQPQGGTGRADSRRTSGGSSPHYHSKFGEPDAVYVYRTPSGAVSHYRLRWESVDEVGTRIKTLRTQAADLTWKDVDKAWPIYGDTTLSGLPNLSIVVCEGEKAVNALNMACEMFDNHLVVAVTCGSTVDMLSHSRRLADRLIELQPARVLLWPDNDRSKRTRAWLGPLKRSLEAGGVEVAVVDVAVLDLPLHAGPDDYLDRGGRLASVLATAFLPPGAPVIEQLTRDLVVVDDGRFLMPGTRRLYEPKLDNLETLWYRHTGGVPKHGALKLLRAQVAALGADSRTQVAWRRWHDDDNTQLYWRPREAGHCYRVDADGVHTSYDPPDALLMVERQTRYSPDVDEGGDFADLEELCGFFGLEGRDVELVLGWLVCALVGLQTPILLLRGEAGAGKSTLARLLMGIIEPSAPHTQLSSNDRFQVDRRELIGALRRSIGVIIDNVTRFSPDAEDLLCQFVTGFSTSHRQLYENDTQLLSFRRAIIITTTSWEVRKGDLATRLLPFNLLGRSSYLSERHIERRFAPHIERIRGFLFRCAVEFFLQRANVDQPSDIRVADLGIALASLGYASQAVASRLFNLRAQVLAQTNWWYDAVVDLYRSQHEGSPPHVGSSFALSGREIVDGMLERGCEEVPSHRSPAFARWMREHNPMFRDAGFVVDYFREANYRGWTFRTIREPDDEVGE